MNSPSPSDPRPALWNPNAAACWSVLFSPAFGAFLHAKNAETLGRMAEAKANRAWFYAALGFIGCTLVSAFFPSIPDAALRYAGLGLLCGWYFSLGKKQIQHVKGTYQNCYRHKPWTKPILIGLGCLGAYAVVALVAVGITDTFFGTHWLE